MPMQWTPEATNRMLLAILKTSSGIKYEAGQIAKYMGPNCTTSAVSHRIGAIRHTVNTMTEDWDSSGSTTIAEPTRGSTGRKRKQSGGAGGDNQDDEHTGPGKPASKRARVKVKKEDMVTDTDELVIVKEEVKEATVEAQGVKQATPAPVKEEKKPGCSEF